MMEIDRAPRAPSGPRPAVGVTIAFAAAVLVAAQGVTPAEAADLGPPPPRRPAYEAPPPDPGLPLPAFDRWTGFYIGGTLGYGFGDLRTDGQIGNFPISTEGVIGTLLAGYNWRIGNAVLGIEADVGFGGLGGSSATTFGNLTGDLNAMGSLRGRAGFLLAPALLVYGTAGFAWADFDFNLADGQARSQMFFGYQAGLGAELAVSSSVSLRLEYLYTDLERERVIHSGLVNTYDPDFHTVRAGLSFRF